MMERDANRPDPRPVSLEVRGASDRPDQSNADIIESGPDGPPRAQRGIAVGLTLALVVIAALAGYLFGSRHRDATATPRAPSSPTAQAGTQPIAGTGKRCSAQLKDQLQLGIEIINQSTTTTTLRQVQAVLPLSGLRATVSTWGSCGQLRASQSGDDYPLPAGATAWLAVTFDILVPCPGSRPVRFRVNYTQVGESATADLPGFADLGDVPYTSAKCPNGSS
jgi:hypothetical protein